MHLYRRGKSGVYYYQRRVSDLIKHDYYNKTHIKFSLKTRNLIEAELFYSPISSFKNSEFQFPVIKTTFHLIYKKCYASKFLFIFLKIIPMKYESIQSFRCWSETCHGQTTKHDIFPIENTEQYIAPNGEAFDVKAVCQHCGRVMGTWHSLLI